MLEGERRSRSDRRPSAALPPSATHQAGTGCLVLIVGPSGAGKDTLIRGARQELAGDPAYEFPRRVVTRPASEAEDNIQVDEASFQAMSAAGEFAATWAAHGLSYGIPKSVEASLAAGRIVVCNVSRTVVSALRASYENVRVIEITAPLEHLSRRLSGRKRPEDGDPGRRLARSGLTPDLQPDVTIVNAGRIEDGVRAFVDALRPETATNAESGGRSGSEK